MTPKLSGRLGSCLLVATDDLHRSSNREAPELEPPSELVPAEAGFGCELLNLAFLGWLGFVLSCEVDGEALMRMFFNREWTTRCVLGAHWNLWQGFKRLFSLPYLMYSQRLLSSSCCCYCCHHGQKHRFCKLICGKMKLDHLLFDQEKRTAKNIQYCHVKAKHEGKTVSKTSAMTTNGILLWNGQ